MKNFLFSLFVIFLILQYFSCNNSNGKKSLFSFEAEERLFIAFAFMNASGFNGEWRDAGMNPIRIEIRNQIIPQLDSLFQSKIKDYHYSHYRGSWSQYAPFALRTTGPLDFQMLPDEYASENGKQIASENEGLSELLAEFYKRAEIKKLWIKYKPLLNEQNYRYKPYAQKSLKRIAEYCRIDSSVFYKSKRTIHFLICPQMSYFTAQNVSMLNELYIIHGPTDGEPSEAAFFHESLHEVINPLTEENKELLINYEELQQLSKERNDLGYEDWESIVNESFVRTIDIALEKEVFQLTEEKTIELIMNEYRLGFILCPFIYENLREFEECSQSINEYFPELISRLSIENETNRWSKYWAQQNEI